MTQGEAHILAHLAGNGLSSVPKLHRSLAHKRSTHTSILDRLNAAAPERAPHQPARPPSFIVSLTPSGKRLAGRIYRRLAAFGAATLKRATPDEFRAFSNVVEAIVHQG